MKTVHAHEVLHMMEGKSFTETSLVEAIEAQFGADARFYACSAEGMDAKEVVTFLQRKGKFKPMDAGFTVDLSRMCGHH